MGGWGGLFLGSSREVEKRELEWKRCWRLTGGAELLSNCNPLAATPQSPEVDAGAKEYSQLEYFLSGHTRSAVKKTIQFFFCLQASLWVSVVPRVKFLHWISSVSVFSVFPQTLDGGMQSGTRPVFRILQPQDAFLASGKSLPFI